MSGSSASSRMDLQVSAGFSSISRRILDDWVCGEGTAVESGGESSLGVYGREDRVGLGAENLQRPRKSAKVDPNETKDEASIRRKLVGQMEHKKGKASGEHKEHKEEEEEELEEDKHGRNSQSRTKSSVKKYALIQEEMRRIADLQQKDAEKRRNKKKSKRKRSDSNSQ